MRVRLMTFRYSATLGGLDDGPLEGTRKFPPGPSTRATHRSDRDR